MEQPQAETSPRDYESLAKRFILFGAIAAVLGIVFAWKVHLAWGVGLGALSLVFFLILLLSSTPNLSRNLTWTFWVLVVFGLTLSLPKGFMIKDSAKDAEIKQNLHAIQLGVVRYFATYDTYLLLVSDVLDTSIMPTFPSNPYARRYRDIEKRPLSDEEWNQQLQMHPITPENTPIPGDFLYTPHLTKDEKGQIHVTGYTLTAFGKDTSETDNSYSQLTVLLILSSNNVQYKSKR